ncbi:MAG: hypothetical protein ACREV8_00340 [Gammaproteobacteria bacterium]
MRRIDRQLMPAGKLSVPGNQAAAMEYADLALTPLDFHRRVSPLVLDVMSRSLTHVGKPCSMQEFLGCDGMSSR